MSCTPFDPTQVPAGTLQKLAKRLAKHPASQGVSLSVCQEVMAQTFGHTSFHALKHKKTVCRASEALADPGTRAFFYERMSTVLLGYMSLPQGLDLLKDLATRGSRWPLRDLCARILEGMRAGQTFGQAFEQVAGSSIPSEVFLITTLQEVGSLSEAMSECLLLARQAADMEDYQALGGRS